MARKDAYELLGVPRSASKADIKKSYRKLARKHHPDLNPGDKAAEQRFKEISEVYRILSDETTRSKYDQFGWAGVDSKAAAEEAQARYGAGGGSRGGSYGFDFGDFHYSSDADAHGFDLGDIFGNVFSGGRTGSQRRRSPIRGDDIHYTMNIGFADAYHGLTTNITVNRHAACDECAGTGVRVGSGNTRCPDCNGTGQTAVKRGPLSFNAACHRCGGAGALPGEPCGKCQGRGATPKTERLSVKIPPGVDNGSKIRLAGKGEPGAPGGPAGDLYIITKVNPHGFFERKGKNLYATIPISFAEAALGAKIEIPTMDGKVSVSVPAGSQSGQALRLKGRGMPQLKGGAKGDLFIELKVAVPRKLSREAKKAVEQLDELVKENPRAQIPFAAETRR